MTGCSLRSQPASPGVQPCRALLCHLLGHVLGAWLSAAELPRPPRPGRCLWADVSFPLGTLSPRRCPHRTLAVAASAFGVWVLLLSLNSAVQWTVWRDPARPAVQGEGRGAAGAGAAHTACWTHGSCGVGGGCDPTQPRLPRTLDHQRPAAPPGRLLRAASTLSSSSPPTLLTPLVHVPPGPSHLHFFMVIPRSCLPGCSSVSTRLGLCCLTHFCISGA